VNRRTDARRGHVTPLMDAALALTAVIVILVVADGESAWMASGLMRGGQPARVLTLMSLRPARAGLMGAEPPALARSALQSVALTATGHPRSLPPHTLTSVHGIRAEGRLRASVTLVSLVQAGPDAMAAGLFGANPVGILIGVAGGIVLLWLALVAVLWHTRKRFDLGTLRGGGRILPDLLRLLKRLAADKSLPRGVRARLWLLLAFVISPIDLIPDFIPVIGYLDDALLVALVLRSVVRRSGQQAIERHWPGDPEGLAAVLRIAGIRDPGRGSDESPG
jgi:uncharacterized membrane protein YkvA (DUF1232 family)